MVFFSLKHEMNRLKNRILALERSHGTRYVHMRRKFNHLLEMSGGGFPGGLRVVIPPAEEEKVADFDAFIDRYTYISGEEKAYIKSIRNDTPDIDFDAGDPIGDHRRSHHENIVKQHGDTVIKQFVAYNEKLEHSAAARVMDEICMQVKAHRLSNDKVYIPNVLSWGKLSEKEMYIRMEFVNGKTLASYDCVDADVYKSLREFLRVLEQSGIRHRDLHEKNILIGENQKIYIIDWGEALLSPTMWEKQFPLPKTCDSDEDFTYIVGTQ